MPFIGRGGSSPPSDTAENPQVTLGVFAFSGYCLSVVGRAVREDGFAPRPIRVLASAARAPSGCARVRGRTPLAPHGRLPALFAMG